MKTGRTLATFLAIALCGTAAGSAQAARKAAARPSSNGVEFTITSSQCASVPAGFDVHATGVQVNHSSQRATGGTLREIVTSHAFGTATDPAGNTYTWSYSFQQNATSTDGQTWTGSAVDHFSLAGSGPVHIVAGFTGSVTYDAASFTITPEQVIGDPIDFATITAHCDPL